MKNFILFLSVLFLASCSIDEPIKSYTFEVYKTDSRHYIIEYHNEVAKGFSIYVDGNKSNVENERSFEKIVADNYGCDMEMTIIHSETWVRVVANGVDEIKKLE